MGRREANLVWLRDTLEHLAAGQERLQWTEDPEAVRLITETMLRDVERCRRLLETLQRRSGGVRQAV
jgi:hypothetical protein